MIEVPTSRRLTPEEIARIADGIDSLITLSCGRCGKTSRFSLWCETPVSGPLPDDVYQCPKCRWSYRRKPVVREWLCDPAIILEPVDSVL